MHILPHYAFDENVIARACIYYHTMHLMKTLSHTHAGSNVRDLVVIEDISDEEFSGFEENPDAAPVSARGKELALYKYHINCVARGFLSTKNLISWRRSDW